MLNGSSGARKSKLEKNLQKGQISGGVSYLCEILALVYLCPSEDSPTLLSIDKLATAFSTQRIGAKSLLSGQMHSRFHF